MAGAFDAKRDHDCASVGWDLGPDILQCLQHTIRMAFQSSEELYHVGPPVAVSQVGGLNRRFGFLHCHCLAPSPRYANDKVTKYSDS